MFKKWFEALFLPMKAMPKLKKEANVGMAVLYVVIGYLIYGVVLGVAIAFLPIMLGAMGGLGMMGGFGLGALSIVTMPIAMIISGIIGLFIGAGLIHLFAYIFGGRNGFVKLIYLMAALTAALAIIGIINIIPLIGPILYILVAIYGIYPTIVAIKEAYEFSWGKAVLSFVIPVIIVLIIFFAFTAAMFAPAMVVM
ncbi:hypothetical protein GF371_04175 [Candidatus Woesearchaeota archaeon]|nr:hypothetical protein [Candidatus Woesearchaeota archaeon]